jgi:hypothetical protein
VAGLFEYLRDLEGRGGGRRCGGGFGLGFGGEGVVEDHWI